MVQLLMVFNKLVIHTHESNLIGESPTENRGMVDVLAKKLCHLGDGILFAILHKDSDEWNFSPYKYSLLVTEIIEILVMLIVSKSNGVGTLL